MNRRAAVSASHTDARVAEAGAAALGAGGSALDAVVACVLCAAGLEPGVLLAPMVALVAGTGAGARAFDGRAAQPGRGLPRPRGFLAGAEVPLAATVAAPRSIAMLGLAHGRFGRIPMRELAKPALEAASAVGASARQALLKQVGASCVTALRNQEVLTALLAFGGPVAGGLLTADDLTSALPDEIEAARHDLRSGGEAILAPWARATSGAVETCLACDGRGLLAALAYVPVPPGGLVEAVGVALPLTAVPVHRGVTRVAPGTPLDAPAHVALALNVQGASAAIGADADLSNLASALTAHVLLDASALRTASGARFAHAVIQDDRAARVVRA